MAVPVSAHVPGIVMPDTAWTTWSLEPLVLVTLAVTSWVYVRGLRRLRSSAPGHIRGVPRASAWSFAAGQTALVVALVSPLDALGGTLLSAHMAQHGILAGLAPPLLLLGAPGVVFAWGVSGVPAVRRLAPVWRALAGLARAFSTPLRATVVHGLTMWLWHAPMLFGAAVEHEWVHALQHLSFFIPAILFWRTLLDEHSAASAGGAAIAAFVTFMHTGLLGGLITMAPEPLYPVYAGRTASWGLTAIEDQHLAGLLMWVPLGLPYVVAGLVLTSHLVRGHVRDVGGRLLLCLCATVILPACAGPQSALDPAGPAAASIHRLGIVLWIGAALVTLLVVVLMLVPFLFRRERVVNRNLFLWGGGIALPAVTLTLLVPYVMMVGQGTRAATTSDRLTIDVTGSLYWWEMAYRRGSDQRPVTSANELRLPIGEPVELFLRANDVIHSFWVPNIAGKVDMIPGRVNRTVIQVDRAGVYRGQCAEYCGAQHSLMAFDVIAMPRPEFDDWLTRLGERAPEPASEELNQGRDLFVSLGCGSCHTVRGVIEGRLGPDLTQVGARRTIGAGTLPGGIGNIAGWIASSQHLKPGNPMPSYDRLEGAQLRALAAWLDSLK